VIPSSIVTPNRRMMKFFIGWLRVYAIVLSTAGKPNTAIKKARRAKQG
jgi:hypothetical protein